MRKAYAIAETANGAKRYFQFWDKAQDGSDILQSQADFDKSIKLFNKSEAPAALKDFRARCRKIGLHLKAELVETDCWMGK